MKLREIFKRPSSLEARDDGLLTSPENNLPEVPKKAVETSDERELKYEEAIKDSEKEYTEEILKVEGQIDEAVRIGQSPEEIEKLKKLKIALEQGGQKVRQNLEEQLFDYRRRKHEKDKQNFALHKEEHEHENFK